MLRAIFRRRMRDAISGCEINNQLFSFRVDVPSIENELRRGGFGESGYEIVELLGIEIEDSRKGQQCCGTCAFWASSKGESLGGCEAPQPDSGDHNPLSDMAATDGAECPCYRPKLEAAK